jgi:hypothetical protein
MPRGAPRFREKCTGLVPSHEARAVPRRATTCTLHTAEPWTTRCARAYRAAWEGTHGVRDHGRARGGGAPRARRDVDDARGGVRREHPLGARVHLRARGRCSSSPSPIGTRPSEAFSFGWAASWASSSWPAPACPCSPRPMACPRIRAQALQNRSRRTRSRARGRRRARGSRRGAARLRAGSCRPNRAAGRPMRPARRATPRATGRPRSPGAAPSAPRRNTTRSESLGGAWCRSATRRS